MGERKLGWRKTLVLCGLDLAELRAIECIFAEGYLWLADAAVYFVHNYDGGAIDLCVRYQQWYALPQGVPLVVGSCCSCCHSWEATARTALRCGGWEYRPLRDTTWEEEGLVVEVERLLLIRVLSCTLAASRQDIRPVDS